MEERKLSENWVNEKVKKGRKERDHYFVEGEAGIKNYY